MLDIVSSSLFRVAEDAIRFQHMLEGLLVAGILVIRMIELREQSINTLYGFGLGVGANLQYLVIIFERILLHVTASVCSFDECSASYLGTGRA